MHHASLRSPRLRLSAYAALVRSAAMVCLRRACSGVRFRSAYPARLREWLAPRPSACAKLVHLRRGHSRGPFWSTCNTPARVRNSCPRAQLRSRLHLARPHVPRMFSWAFLVCVRRACPRESRDSRPSARVKLVRVRKASLRAPLPSACAALVSTLAVPVRVLSSGSHARLRYAYGSPVRVRRSRLRVLLQYACYSPVHVRSACPRVPRTFTFIFNYKNYRIHWISTLKIDAFRTLVLPQPCRVINPNLIKIHYL